MFDVCLSNYSFFLFLVEYSMLLVSFHLQRHMGNFLIQVYGPCMLLVVLSWVSFWLNREATADRISLGMKYIGCLINLLFLSIFRYNDSINNDFFGSRSKNQSTKSPISDSFGFLRVSIIFIHFCNNHTGKNVN